MQSKKILLAILLSLTFTACKKDSSNPPLGTKAEEPLFQSFQMMNAASVRFIEIGDSMNITPPEHSIIPAYGFKLNLALQNLSHWTAPTLS